MPAMKSVARVPFATAIFAASLLSANAALLVSESFSGYTTGNINNKAATGTGLTGSYSSTGAFSYQATGLSFAYIATSGGSLSISSSAANIAGVQIGAIGAVTGDVFVSYLFNKPGNFSSDAASLVETRINSTITGAAATSQFRAQTNTDNASSNFTGIGYDSSPTTGGTALTLNSTTYLVLAKYSNVGNELSVGSPGIATLWILTEAQYTNLHTLGVTEANLNALSIGTGASNVFARVTDTATSGTFTLGEGSFLQFAATGSSTSNQSGVIDELRIGTTLADVTPVPEPSAWLGAAAGLALAALRRRR